MLSRTCDADAPYPNTDIKPPSCSIFLCLQGRTVRKNYVGEDERTH